MSGPIVKSLENFGGKIYNEFHPLHKAISGPPIIARESYDVYIKGSGLMGWAYPTNEDIQAFFRGRLRNLMQVKGLSHDPLSSTFKITVTPLKPMPKDQIANSLLTVMNAYAGFWLHFGSFKVTDIEKAGALDDWMSKADSLLPLLAIGVIGFIAVRELRL